MTPRTTRRAALLLLLGAGIPGAARASTGASPAAPPAPVRPAAAPASASPAAAPVPSGPVLRVGVAGSPPFVVPGKGVPTGLALDVWREAAHRAGLRYRLVPVAGVARALEAVAGGTLDVAVGPISITAARARTVAFTQPYYQASLGILAHARSSVWQRIAPFASRAFLVAVGVLSLVLVLVGLLLWLAERRANPEQFPERPVSGIGNGIWLALVTMTTVGYGDRAPVTPVGRVITGIWMLVAMVTASSLTAGIATAFTLSQLSHTTIASADDLGGRKVAVVRGTTGAAFARDRDARVVETATLDEAVTALRDRRADAVVFDRPMLRYWLRQHPDASLRLAAPSYQPQGYGFATPPGSDVRRRLSVALLAMHEDRRIRAIADHWLGP